jgi:hypothetical protein
MAAWPHSTGFAALPLRTKQLALKRAGCTSAPGRHRRARKGAEDPAGAGDLGPRGSADHCRFLSGPSSQRFPPPLRLGRLVHLAQALTHYVSSIAELRAPRSAAYSSSWFTAKAPLFQLGDHVRSRLRSRIRAEAAPCFGCWGRPVTERVPLSAAITVVSTLRAALPRSANSGPTFAEGTKSVGEARDGQRLVGPQWALGNACGTWLPTRRGDSSSSSQCPG